MVQIIDEGPSFGGQIGRVLGKGLVGGGLGALEGHLENKASERMKDYYEDLAKKNPENPLYQQMRDVYAGPGGMEQKKEIARLLMSGGDVRAKQQSRLEQESTLKKYNSRIKELDREILDAQGEPEKREKLKRLRKALQLERDGLLGFSSLEESFSDNEEGSLTDNIDELFTKKKPASTKQKTKFDRNNSEHMAKVKQLEKKFKGDRKKVNEALAKEFSM